MYEDSPAPISQPPPTPVDHNEVYVDDFIGATNDLSQDHLTHRSRSILHGIHCIFPPPQVSGHNGGNPISEKKLKKGKGLWHYEKEILGWIFNGMDYTIYLPPEKSEKICAMLKKIATAASATLKEFQSMAGKLNHAAFGIPCGKGLSSPIFKAMTTEAESIPITPALKQALQDWNILLQHISTWQTSVLELTPGDPAYIGYVDASGFGAGGVWISGNRHIPPTVWRIPFPPEVENSLVSFTNKSGTITNSDLEMAGLLLQWLVLETIASQSLKHTHIAIFSDNTPTVAWENRLSASSSTVAGRLLRALALRQHAHQASPLLTVSIAGDQNTMADEASRSFRKGMPAIAIKTCSVSFQKLTDIAEQ